MSTILGRVENPRVLAAPLYFVHDSTSGHSYPVLFSSPEVMWETWDKNCDCRDLEKAVPATSKSLMVARISFAYGRQFDSSGETDGEPSFGLVTADRLISTSQGQGRHLSLLQVKGVKHIAEIAGGFEGRYDAPICTESYTPTPADRSIGLREVFEQPHLDVCSTCVAKVTNV